MASQSTIFKKGEQEFEQGQIQSNNASLDPLPLRGSAINGERLVSLSVSMSKIIKAQPQPFHHLKDLTSDQFQTSELTKNQKKYQRDTLPMTNNYTYDNARHLEPKEKNRIVGGLDNPSNSYQKYKNNFEPKFYDSSSKSSYNLNKNRLGWNKKQIQNSQEKNPYLEYSRSPTTFYNQIDNNFNSPYFNQTLPLFPNKYIQIKEKDLNDKSSKVENFLSNQKDKNNGYNNKNKQKVQKAQEKQKQEKTKVKQQIQKQRIYFNSNDWQRLFYIIEEIILENNNGVKNLWHFINNIEPNKKYKKGKRIFEILYILGMQQIIDKLIEQQKKYKEEKKQKQTKLHSLIFNLVRRLK